MNSDCETRELIDWPKSLKNHHQEVNYSISYSDPWHLYVTREISTSLTNTTDMTLRFASSTFFFCSTNRRKLVSLFPEIFYTIHQWTYRSLRRGPVPVSDMGQCLSLFISSRPSQIFRLCVTWTRHWPRGTWSPEEASGHLTVSQTQRAFDVSMIRMFFKEKKAYNVTAVISQSYAFSFGTQLDPVGSLETVGILEICIHFVDGYVGSYALSLRTSSGIRRDTKRFLIAVRHQYIYSWACHNIW